MCAVLAVQADRARVWVKGWMLEGVRHQQRLRGHNKHNRNACSKLVTVRLGHVVVECEPLMVARVLLQPSRG